MTPDDRRYSAEHEWALIEGDEVVVGITDFAQAQLGDVVYVELPRQGDHVKQMKVMGVIESVKAASDLYAPVDGEVLERNEKVLDSPELVNSSPYEEAWLVRIRVSDPNQLETLLSPADYDAFAETASTR